MLLRIICRKLTVPVLREYLVCEYEDKRKLKDGDTKYFAKELIEKVRFSMHNFTFVALFVKFLVMHSFKFQFFQFRLVIA